MALGHFLSFPGCHGVGVEQLQQIFCLSLCHSFFARDLANLEPQIVLRQIYYQRTSIALLALLNLAVFPWFTIK